MSILRYRRYLSVIQAAATYLPLVGVTNGSNAPAGQIGEFLTAQQLTNQPMTNAVTMNIVSLSLTPGDWDVDGVVFLASSTSVGMVLIASISTISAALPTGGTPGRTQLNPVPGGAYQAVVLPTGRVRVNVASTTPVYLVAQMTFASGTGNAQGTIQARRMR